MSKKVGIDSETGLYAALRKGAEHEDCFFISGSRHDRDRIEVQLGFDGLVGQDRGQFMYDVDFVLFVPKSLGLLEVEDQNSLRTEFQSYVRLHTHSGDPNSETSYLRVKERIKQLRVSATIDVVRNLAVESEAFIKAATKRARKDFEKIPDHRIKIQSLEECVDQVLDIVSDFRSILAEHHVERLEPIHANPGSLEYNMLLLSEYLSHVYVQFLVSTELLLKTEEWALGLCKKLREAETSESVFRAAHHLLVEDNESGLAIDREELYLRRIGLLKKYFHKALFVSYKGEPFKTKMMIPVYGISAALAASWAIMVQLYQINSMSDRVGINSIAFITVAVLGYVAKDLLKDFFRKYFYQTTNKFFADFERKLFVERDGRSLSLGSIKEYIRTLDSEHLPEDLKRARYSVEGGEIEETLHEDILHFKKRVELNLKFLDTKKEFPWGLREVVRYRFDRLLPSMEDAYKGLFLLSRSGAGSQRQGHRVYQVHIACWIRRHASLYKWSRLETPTKPEFKAYRVTLDKTGVISCESVKWKRVAGIPSLPT